MKKILGIRLGHDATACLIVDGKIIANVAEERFTRKKNDGSFPVNAISYCLKTGGITSADLDGIAVPTTSYNSIFAAFFPNLAIGAAPEQTSSMRSCIKKLLGKSVQASTPDPLPTYMPRFPVSSKCRFIQIPHHKAHAASAYYTAGLSKDEKTLVLVMDGKGDHSAVSVWRGQDNRLERLASWGEEGSLGRFYSAATEALGWRHGSGEWKLMGFAPYGKQQSGFFDGDHPVFKDGELVRGCQFAPVQRFPDRGTWHYHMQESISLRAKMGDMKAEDFAAEAQSVVEEQALNLALPWLEREGTRNLCCAGGFFLNVKVNGLLWASGRIDKHWIYPDPGDSGLALGAAMSAYFEQHPEQQAVPMEHLYYGPEYDADTIEAALNSRRIRYTRPEQLIKTVAKLLSENKIIGWYQGRMEAGPRALGNRSILMSPLESSNKDIINASVKYREAFRPFCPSMLAEKKEDYLTRPRMEPFMITAFDVTEEKQDKIPAVVHVDGTMRPQTVRAEANPRYHALIKAFGDITGEYVILNTSFNVRGEPIVNTPSDAIKCFYDSGLEYLVLGDYLISKYDE